jgi:hypothetical protein
MVYMVDSGSDSHSKFQGPRAGSVLAGLLSFSEPYLYSSLICKMKMIMALSHKVTMRIKRLIFIKHIKKQHLAHKCWLNKTSIPQRLQLESYKDALQWCYVSFRDLLWTQHLGTSQGKSSQRSHVADCMSVPFHQDPDSFYSLTPRPWVALAPGPAGWRLSSRYTSQSSSTEGGPALSPTKAFFAKYSSPRHITWFHRTKQHNQALPLPVSSKNKTLRIGHLTLKTKV